MASFSDSSQIQFNPFIHQLPIDAYTRAELYKQGKYDQGVQSVQSYLDSTTGLEVPDKYKQYLQNSVSSLQDQVKKVAGADFSNMQLVNEIGGATSKLIGDKTIQTGIQSAANDSSQRAQMKKDQTEGKLNPSNQWDYLNQYDSWSKNPDLSQAFTGSYTTHKDYQKKWIEAQEKLGVDERTTDLPFLTDRSGRWIDKQGNLSNEPVLNDVMVERTFKGKDSQKVKNAIMTIMDEGDVKQMDIDARYHFRNTSPQDLKPYLDNSYNKSLNDLDQQTKNYTLLKGLNPNNTEYQKSLDQALSDIKTAKDKVVQNRDRDYSLLTTNPDFIKNKIYSSQTIDDFANTFSNKQEVEKIVNNPYIEKQDKDRNYLLAVDRFKDEQWYRKAELEISRNKFDFEVMKDKRDNTPGTGLLNTGEYDMGDNTSVTKPTIVSFNDDAQKDKDIIDNGDREFLEKYYSKDANGNPISLEDGKKALALYEDAFLHNGKDIPVAFRDYISSIKPVKDEFDRKQSLLVNINKDADDKYKEATDKINQTSHNINVGSDSYNKGTVLSLALKTKDYFDKMGNMVSGGTGGAAAPPASFYDKIQSDFENSLSYEERGLYKWYKANPEVKKRVDDVSSRVVPEMKGLIDEKSKYVNDELLKRTQQYKAVSYSFNTTKPDKLKLVQDKIGQVLDQINSIGGETESGGGHFNLAEARELNNGTETKYSVIKQSGDKVIIAVSGKGSKTNYIPILKNDFENLFNTPLSAPNQKVADVMAYTKGVSTNVQHSDIFNDPEAYKTAYFSKSPNRDIDNFPNVKNYTVKADIGKLSSGKVTARIYIKDPVGNWKSFEGPVGIDIDNMVKSLRDMTDDQVKQLLTQNK